MHACVFCELIKVGLNHMKLTLPTGTLGNKGKLSLQALPPHNASLDM